VYHFVNLIKSIHVCSFSFGKIRFESPAKSNKKDEVWAFDAMNQTHN
jgi:hypothetical protein